MTVIHIITENGTHQDYYFESTTAAELAAYSRGTAAQVLCNRCTGLFPKCHDALSTLIQCGIPAERPLFCVPLFPRS